MEHSVQSRRREERVPLDALVELRTDESGEILEADGLDLSPGGVSMRAAFVPPVGARLHCQFRCAPDGERVRAEGEVVWSNWSSDHDGSFGLRFLALDTKSATAIRRHVEPEPPVQAAPPPKGPVQMRIDGLAVPIEADVLFADFGSLVLEQNLTFLKLGRGVAVDLPGRGLKRGRIGSVELRQGPLDVPTLVFGILLDAEPSAALEPEFARVSAQRSVSKLMRGVHAERPLARSSVSRAEFDPRALSSDGSSELACAADARSADSESDEPARASEEEIAAPQRPPEHSVSEHADGRVALVRDVSEPGEGDALAARVQGAPEAHSASNAVPSPCRASGQAHEAQADAVAADAATDSVARRDSEKVWQLEQALPVLRDASRAWLREWLPAAQTKLRAARSALASWLTRTLAVRSWFGEQFAALRQWLGAQRGRIAAFRRLRRAKSRATAPAPRVQRTQRGAGRAAPSVVKPRHQRFVALLLAALGVGLGVYALAPRSGADRIRIHTVAAPSTQEPALEEPAPSVDAPAAVVPEELAPTSAEASPGSDAAENAPSPAQPLRFGEDSVPNGRTFSLRMSGPVEELEGESREDGFTVKVPGRLALDKASPIASSHRSVQRAMILNRGDYAELTIDFVPGLRPRYQVLAKDAALEVTLERL